MLKFIVALTVSVMASAAHAQQDGELWEMSVSSAEGNQPMGSAITNKICLPKRETADQKMPEMDKDVNCKSEYKASGNKTKYKSVCLMDGQKLTSEGVQEIVGPDHFRGEGTITMEDKSGKRVTRQVSSIKKVGACKVEAFAGMKPPEMKQACESGIDSVEGSMFLGKNAMCASDKPKFCAKVKQLAESYKDPSKFTIPSDSWEESTKACGVDLPAITRVACQRANDSRKWDFIADYCPADAKAIAAKQCTGRSGTAAMQSEYAQICQSTASDTVSNGASKDNPVAEESAAPSETPSKKKGKNFLDQGKDLLKSLF